MAQVQGKLPGNQWNHIQVPGNPGPTRREETACRPIWGYTTEATANGNPRRTKPECRSTRTERTDQTTPCRKVRTLRITRGRRSSSYPKARRPRKRGPRTTTMGQNHGDPPKKNPRCVSLLSSGYPCRTAYTTESIGLNDWKAVCSETGTYSLVGGRWNRAISVPRQRPTQLNSLEIPRAFACRFG